MAAPSPAAGTGAPRTGGNLLTNKLGPLPTWAWLGIATVLIAIAALLMRKKSGSSQATPGQTAGQQFVPDIIIQNGPGLGGPGGTTAPPPVTTPPVTTPPPGSVPPSPPPPTGGSTGPTPFNWRNPPQLGAPPGTSTADQLGQQIAAQQQHAGTILPPAAAPATGKKTTKAKPAAKKYTNVTVAKWTSKNTPWNSTLSGIAAHFHVSVAELAKLNGIANPNLIYPGQVIRVPA